MSRARLPVRVDVTGERLPEALEATAYFIAAEALTNVLKHARASSAQILAVIEGRVEGGPPSKTSASATVGLPSAR